MHFIQNELYNIHCMRKITHIFISNENEKLSYSEEENSMYMYLLQHYKWMKFFQSTNQTPIHTSTFSKMII